ncbi:hypothetical protein HOY82DRAFT_613930 [Tuber indicum]|nr:hypothetical protein HOY82DRAFT_613930 [Tuber indicum]
MDITALTSDRDTPCIGILVGIEHVINSVSEILSSFPTYYTHSERVGSIQNINLVAGTKLLATDCEGMSNNAMWRVRAPDKTEDGGITVVPAHSYKSEWPTTICAIPIHINVISVDSRPPCALMPRHIKALAPPPTVYVYQKQLLVLMLIKRGSDA